MVKLLKNNISLLKHLCVQRFLSFFHQLFFFFILQHILGGEGRQKTIIDQVIIFLDPKDLRYRIRESVTVISRMRRI